MRSRSLLSSLLLSAVLMSISPRLAAEAPAAGGPTMLSASLSPDAADERRLDRFAALLDEAAEKDDFVGFAVAVVERGEIKLLRTYGVREAGGAAPVTPDTVFRIASLSKGFAASLAGLAIAEGKISKATPVAPFEPQLALPGGAQSALTVEHILSHRVGLPPNAYDNLLEAGVPVEDILPKFRAVKPICKIGQCYAYQNITFSMIGDILAAEYDTAFADLVRTRLFEPLGMATASVGRQGLEASLDWARPNKRKRIPGVDGAFTPWRVVEVDDAYYRTAAAGGVNASITDMARWLIAQMGGAPDVLPQSVLDDIHAPVIKTPSETRRWASLAARVTDTQYGLGWRIYDYAGHQVINHSGGVEGYGAQIAWLPERDIGIVILSNTRAKRVYRILPAFLDLELGLDDQDWLELDEVKFASPGEVDPNDEEEGG
ncbi:MAG: serine hydrolase domain-containing protein [Parvularculaceae bacterium]